MNCLHRCPDSAHPQSLKPKQKKNQRPKLNPKTDHNDPLAVVVTTAIEIVTNHEAADHAAHVQTVAVTAIEIATTKTKKSSLARKASRSPKTATAKRAMKIDLAAADDDAAVAAETENVAAAETVSVVAAEIVNVESVRKSRQRAKTKLKNAQHHVPKMAKTATSHDVPNADDAEDVLRAIKRSQLLRSQKTMNSKSRTSKAATRTRRATSKKNDHVDDHVAVVEGVVAAGAETAATTVDHKTARRETLANRKTSK